MKTLRNALQDYLAMRRALGFKLAEAGIALADFISFLERKRAPHITTRLALAWAQRPAHVQPAMWAQRLTWVRGFARYRSATDPKTEIPPSRLLPFRAKRARPYLYGSARESVTPPDLMGILILGNSGYTQQDERDGLEQSTGLAGVSGLPIRNRGAGKNAEAVGSAEARKPETGLLGMWAEASRCL